MPQFEVPEVDFGRYSNRQLAGPPAAVIVVAVLVIAGVFITTGTPVPLGTEFTGGTELRVRTPTGNPNFDATFDAPIQSVQWVQGGDNTAILSFGADADADALRSQAENEGYTVLGVQSTSPTFAKSTQRLALIGVVIAFAGMSVVVFALFRVFVPSLAVVLSAFGDIVVPVALMNLLGIELSLGTVAALLMVIGYSVDSDILLTNHVLRRSGGFYESVRRAMVTGVTMTVTSLSAMAVMAVVARLFGIQLLAAIGTVLVLGLVTDLMNTYMLNVTLLRWYTFRGAAE
ncbi:MAG: protein translocase subunit SecF [Halodesulfurarchaeum sp.]